MSVIAKTGFKSSNSGQMHCKIVVQSTNVHAVNFQAEQCDKRQEAILPLSVSLKPV